MFILPGTRSDVTLLSRAEGTAGREGGTLRAWEGTGGELAVLRSTLESSPSLQLPSGPGGCSALGQLKGSHTASISSGAEQFPPHRDPLGWLGWGSWGN